MTRIQSPYVPPTTYRKTSTYRYMTTSFRLALCTRTAFRSKHSRQLNRPNQEARQ